MLICEVKSSRSPLFTLKWMCGAGRPGYGNGLDGAEVVLPLGPGRELSETLKVLVALFAFALAVTGVQIDLVGVALPDLDCHVLDRTAGRGEDPAFQVRDFPDRRCDPVPDDDQVVVLVQRAACRGRTDLPSLPA